MADGSGRKVSSVFFIYDHSMLKKEEDDLKDAILYFTPEEISVDNQCMLCGQLMGMSEFMTETLAKASPTVFKFERDKFAVKRIGTYSLVLQGGYFTPDTLLMSKLDCLYETFVTFHGSIESLKLRCKDHQGGYSTELANIWRVILRVSGVCHITTYTQTFQSLPYIQLPKTASHLFLQASHLLQSSQRRPYVLGGTILYKNGVLSTQLPPKLTKHLTYLQNQMPHITQNTDFDLPKGCKIVTVFLTDEELLEISPVDNLSRRHCNISDFTVSRENPKDPSSPLPQNGKSSTKQRTRRLTCPEFSSPTNSAKSNTGNVSQKALQSFLTSERRKQGSLNMEQLPWGHRNSQISLSHVPIVECRSGESPTVDSESESGMMYNSAMKAHFGEKKFTESYKEMPVTSTWENELSESDSESPSEFNDVTIDAKCATTLQKSSSEHINSPNSAMQNDKPHTNTGHSEAGQKNHLLSASKPDVPKDQKHVEIKNVKGKSETPEEAENPSISDLEDDEEENVIKNTEKTNIETKPLNLSEKSDQQPVNSNNRSIETFSESEASLKEHQRETTQEHNPTKDKGDKNLLSSKDIHLSASSDDDFTSRFYDKLTDEQTETMVCVSSHSIHQHKADVHLATPKLTETADDISQNDATTETGRKNDANSAETEEVLDGTLLTGDATREMDCENDVTPRSEILTKGEHEHKENSNNSREQKSETGGNSEKLVASDNTQIKNSHSRTVESYSKETGNNNLKNLPSATQPSPNFKIEGTGHVVRKKSEDSDIEKENADPNLSSSAVRFYNRTISEMSTDTQQYESEIETEDEGFTLAQTEPCIACLELEVELKVQKGDVRLGVIRCESCVEKFNRKKVFGVRGVNNEVIDFGNGSKVKGAQAYESGTETEGIADADKRHGTSETKGNNFSEVAMASLSSFSSDVSTDSTISKYWTQEMDGLNDVTLYVQCHSDISLLLLMENPDPQHKDSLFHALWKGCLAHLADLDYYIKESTDSSSGEEERSKDSYKFLRHNTFSADTRGSITDPGSDRKSLNLHQMVSTLHSEFQLNHCLSEVTVRSHMNSCYGHSNHVDETYFQPEMQFKNISGMPVPHERTYHMDVSARKLLAKDKQLSLI